MPSDAVPYSPASHPPGSTATALGDYFGWVIVELAPDAIFVVDERGRLVLANRRAEDLFGYDRDALVGLAVDALVPESLRAAHRAHRAHYEASPTTRPMGSGLDLRGRRADGSEFPVEISLSPVTVGEGVRVVVIVREVLAGRDASKAAHRGGSADDEHRVADLHDEVIKHLFAAGIALDPLAEHLDDNLSQRLTTAINELDLAIRKIRNFELTSCTVAPTPDL